MREKTVEKIKKIINEVVSRKYGGNRIAMPYFKGEHGDISGEDLSGSPADSNSFMSYMTLHYYDITYLDPVIAGFEARLDEIDETLYPHVNNDTIHVTAQDKTNWNNHVSDSTIHVTAQDKTNWNNHVSDSTIHVTAQDKTNWNGKSTVTVSEEEVEGAPIIKSMTNNGTAYNFPSGGGEQPHLYRHMIRIRGNNDANAIGFEVLCPIPKFNNITEFFDYWYNHLEPLTSALSVSGYAEIGGNRKLFYQLSIFEDFITIHGNDFTTSFASKDSSNIFDWVAQIF